MTGGALGDSGYRATFLDHFDSLTPENEMKMDTLHPSEDEWAWGPADGLVDLATANAKQVRGHTLVWYAQLPGWVTSRTWTRSTLSAYLDDYVARVVGHYRGRVRDWDVVNEAVAGGGGMRDSLWQRVIGPAYVARAFRAAHAADPGARLWLNDYYAEWDSAKAASQLALVKSLLADGVPIDGVGFQLHSGSVYYAPTEAQVAEAFAPYADLGLAVAVTEMDVDTQYTSGSAATKDAAAQAVYRNAATACQQQPRCSSFNVWGVADAQSWIGADKRPLLFDTAYREKPAYGTVTRRLRP